MVISGKCRVGEEVPGVGRRYTECAGEQREYSEDANHHDNIDQITRHRNGLTRRWSEDELILEEENKEKPLSGNDDWTLIPAGPRMPSQRATL